MKTNESEHEKTAIKQRLEKYYFQGLWDGNLELLNEVFHKDTLLFGDIKDQPYAKTLDQYLDGVAHRISPRDSGKPYQTEVISIDVVNSIGIAKVRVKMYDFNYFDLLSFHKINDTWKIVNKMLTHVEE